MWGTGRNVLSTPRIRDNCRTASTLNFSRLHVHVQGSLRANSNEEYKIPIRGRFVVNVDILCHDSPPNTCVFAETSVCEAI